MPRRPSKPPLELILAVYDAFLREYEINKVAAACKVPACRMTTLLQECKELQVARAIAEERRKQTNDLPTYIVGHLSKEARIKWEEIMYWRGHEEEYEKVEMAMQTARKKLRQELFMHAMIRNSWNASEACRITHTSYQTYDDWKSRDEDFKRLDAEIEIHKKNFFEQCLIDLVGMRDPTAVMFVNRTKNRDRGYNEKVQVEVSGTVNHEVNVNVEELELSVEVKRSLLDAVRKKKTSMGQVLEAEEVKALPAPVAE